MIPRVSRYHRKSIAQACFQSLEPRRLLAAIVVNTTADNAIAGDGLTTLREAITAANATPAVADTITFELGAGAHTINLGGALPSLSTEMTIQGPGANLLTVRRDTGGDYRIFTVPAGTVRLAGLTISNGVTTVAVGGGGVHNAATLTVDDCVIRDNEAKFGSPATFASGGGVTNDGTLTINNSIISNNTAADRGGGINNTGVLTVNNSTISNNTSNSYGGGINNTYYNVSNSSSLTVNDCTVSGNTSTYGGGGINSFTPDLTVRNSAISANTGGGIFIYPNSQLGTATISDCTVSDNTTSGTNPAYGAAISHYFSSLLVSNCTISGNTGESAVFNHGSLVVSGTSFDQNTGLGLETHYLGNPVTEVSGCTFSYNAGGGIHKQAGSLNVSSSTFYGNTSASGGAGAINADLADTITYCTIVGNASNGGTAGGVWGGTIRNSIVAGNTTVDGANRDVYNYIDSGYNFIGGDPKLGALADNGGPTQTMALLPDSPCINRGDPNFAGPADYDQRGAGFARKVGPRIDIGAFESDVLNTKPTAIAMDPVTALDDSTTTIDLRNSFDDAEEDAASLVYTVVGNTNPALVISSSVDDVTDELKLSYAQDAEGVAEITVRATDSGGLFTEQSFDLTVLVSSFEVNTTADVSVMGDGLTSLREAITAANVEPDPNTITFDLGPGAHTINLTGALPVIVTDMSIQGPAADLLTLRRDTGGDYAVLSIGSWYEPTSAKVQVADMTIANGFALASNNNGGGIDVIGLDLTLHNVVLSGNTGFLGGGLYIGGGSATLNNCMISGNTAPQGGGIYAEYGEITITDSTIDGNTADYEGGGIYHHDGDLTITGSTISHNTVAGDSSGTRGGGIASLSGYMTIQSSTIAYNAVTSGDASYGGGIAAWSYTFTLRNSTVAGNSAHVTGGVWYGSSTIEISNSIIASNANGDLFDNSSEPAYKHNFIGDDHPGVDAMLGPLADNGGPTKTMAVLPGSPLINAGDPAFTGPPDFDQRGSGYNRVIGGQLDIGAFELNTVAPAVQTSQFIYDAAPQSLVFKFTTDASATLGVSDLILENLTSSITIPAANIAVSYDNATDTATYTFPGYPHGALPDGEYRATLLAAGVTDGLGTPLAYSDVSSFFFLAGDANHDRTVDITDLGILATHWQGANKMFSQGDFNYDGIVDITDLGILATNWQKTLLAPGQLQTGTTRSDRPLRSPLNLATSARQSLVEEIDRNASLIC